MKMIKNKFLLIFAIVFLIYLVPEIFFESTMLYITGGIIGGSIYEVLKYFVKAPSYYLVFSIWILILIGTTISLFYRLINKPLKYLTLIIITALLYIIDFIIMSLVDYDSNIWKSFLFKGFLLFLITFLKSLILSFIIYYGLDYNTKKIK